MMMNISKNQMTTIITEDRKKGKMITIRGKYRGFVFDEDGKVTRPTVDVVHHFPEENIDRMSWENGTATICLKEHGIAYSIYSTWDVFNQFIANYRKGGYFDFTGKE